MTNCYQMINMMLLLLVKLYRLHKIVIPTTFPDKGNSFAYFHLNEMLSLL